MKRSKLYRARLATYERDTAYGLPDAVQLLKDMPPSKFDETVEVVFRLGIDPRQSDQVVRGAVVLPHGTGRSVRIVVIASGDAAQAATDAGADEVGAEELLERIKSGWLDFDVMIATPAAMKQVRALGRVLGPRGLMPNPKTGTVTPDPTAAVADAKAGKINFRVDRGGNVHAPLGLLSFEVDALYANAHAYFDAIQRARPTTIKGQYVKSITLSGTMTPGVRVDRSDIQSIST